jgi:hypothetical protein
VVVSQDVAAAGADGFVSCRHDSGGDPRHDGRDTGHHGRATDTTGAPNPHADSGNSAGDHAGSDATARGGGSRDGVGDEPVRWDR